MNAILAIAAILMAVYVGFAVYFFVSGCGYRRNGGFDDDGTVLDCMKAIAWASARWPSEMWAAYKDLREGRK